MARYPCEMFAQFYYSPDLTYDELYRAEEELMKKLDIIFTEEGGIHLEFWPDSDSFAVQGQFDEFDRYKFDRMADKIKTLLPRPVQSRILLVDRTGLGKIFIYNLTYDNREFEEITLPRPFANA